MAFSLLPRADCRPSPRGLCLGLSVALWMTPLSVWALGLGELALGSALQQRLEAEVPVFEASASEGLGLRVEVLAPEQGEAAGIAAELGSRGGQPVIRLRSREPVREPVLQLRLEVRQGGVRVARDYTLLLDLPGPAPVPARPDRGPALLASDPPQPPLPAVPAVAPPVPAAASADRDAAGAVGCRPWSAASPQPRPERLRRYDPETHRYGPVEPGESLSRIAYRLRALYGCAPQAPLREQLYGLNPEAFEGRPEALIVGSWLRLPETLGTGEVASELAGEGASTAGAEPDPVALPATGEADAPVTGEVDPPAPLPSLTSAGLPSLRPSERLQTIPATAPTPAPLAAAPPGVEAAVAPSSRSAAVADRGLPWVWILGTLLLAGLLWVLARRRPRRSARAAAVPEPMMPPAEVLPPPAAPPVAAAAAVETLAEVRPAAPARRDAEALVAGELGETVDFYSELAELLHHSLQAEPGRQDLRLKLLEVYYTANRREPFGEEALTFRRRASGRDLEDWPRILEMWSLLAPGEPLGTQALPEAPLAPARRFADLGLRLGREALQDFASECDALRRQPHFYDELAAELSPLLARPSALMELRNWTEGHRGARLFLKREDLRQVPPEKDNALAQALLARRLGRRRLVASAEPLAHAEAVAWSAARLGLACTLYASRETLAFHAREVQLLQGQGAELREARSLPLLGSDPREAALRDWLTAPREAYLLLDRSAGPMPHPTLVRGSFSLLGRETLSQFLAAGLPLPAAMVAATGSRSDALGFIQPALEHSGIALYLAESASGAASSGEDEALAGLAREHAWLRASGRVRYVAVGDAETQTAQRQLAAAVDLQTRLDDARALALAFQVAAGLGEEQSVVLLLAG
ncbi:MAG TPA: pyridoxal-phosphate dependent enzyme [Nevskiaceae bacterium]|nr:pyridoxal-phosphate dependent enzyme [Nevskiaceae bacterium]